MAPGRFTSNSDRGLLPTASVTVFQHGSPPLCIVDSTHTTLRRDMAAGIILQYPFGIGEAEYDAVNAKLGWIPKTGEGDRQDGQQSLGRDPDFGAGDGLGHQVGHPVVVVANLARDGPGLG